MIYEVIDGPYPCESGSSEVGSCLYVKGWFDGEKKNRELWFRDKDLADFVLISIQTEFTPLDLAGHVDLYNVQQEKELGLNDLN